MRLAIVAVAVACGFGTAAAKLPPLTDEAKAKAAETAAKTAWADKVGLYKMCLAMDRVALTYRTSAKAAGRDAPSPDPMPACADPGPFVAPVTAAADKPIEASGAHSPPGMATAPPSSNPTSAEMTGPRK